MFSEIKRIFIHPCHVCENPHACDECPEVGNHKVPSLPRRNKEGKVIIASGEDVPYIEEGYVVC